MLSHDQMRQKSRPLWWTLRITRKTMTLGLNQEGTKQKYTYQKLLTSRSWKVGVEYTAQVHWFDFSLCSLCEKCPNTEFYLVRIFLYSVLIQENTDQKILRFLTRFSQWLSQLTVTTKRLWKEKNDTERGLKNHQKMIT